MAKGSETGTPGTSPALLKKEVRPYFLASVEPLEKYNTLGGQELRTVMQKNHNPLFPWKWYLRVARPDVLLRMTWTDMDGFNTYTGPPGLSLLEDYFRGAYGKPWAVGVAIAAFHELSPEEIVAAWFTSQKGSGE